MTGIDDKWMTVNWQTHELRLIAASVGRHAFGDSWRMMRHDVTKFQDG